MSTVLCDAVRAKVEEQIERTERLIGLVPADRLQWAPAYARAWRVEEVLGHLLECLAGFCAVLFAVEPVRLSHFRELQGRGLRACSPEQARERIALYRRHIDEGFARLDDAALGRTLPTVFVPAGETVLTLLLGNLEHLINHKHQLFTYLREMGVEAGTGDLYRLRGAGESGE